MASRTCEALLISSNSGVGPQLVKKHIPCPEPGPEEALVRVTYVAQNPTDVQSFDSQAFEDGAVLGCDFVGTVTQIGQAVTRLAEGDTIAGLIWGGEIQGRGGYAQYTIADEKICFKIPSGIPLDAAATVPLATLTAWLALWSKDCLGLDRSATDKPRVLIWGGSSSVGQYAIQIASMHGFEVVTTCSPKHFDLVRSLGAQHVADSRADNVVEQIRDSLTAENKTAPIYAFDTIGNETSSQLASRVMDATQTTSLCTVRPGKANTDNVTANTKVSDVLVWTAFYKEHKYGDFKWPPHEADHILASEFCEKIGEWLGSGKIRPNEPRLLDGGLNAVADGFQEYRDGKISAYKVVYMIR